MPDSLNPTDTLALRNVTALLPDGFKDGLTLVLRNGVIEEVASRTVASDNELDCGGLILFPGLVDLHGDAFEREIAPRAGIGFPLDMAIESNDAALIASGITTFFYSITDGFEPGVRSRETVRGLLDGIDTLRPLLLSDSRIHIRHECVATEGHDELLGWIDSHRVDLLSLNDHLPPQDDAWKNERYKVGASRRFSMSPEEMEAFVADRQARRPLGEEQTRELAAAAHAKGVALASHDERSDADATKAAKLNVSICEFPLTTECAEKGLARGAAVVMGAPNLVRGGSHVGGASVRDEVKAGRVNILVSDYYYPALLRAPFLLAELGILPLEQAWRLVSANPADAVGLSRCKGHIAEGCDADLLGLRPRGGEGLRGMASDVSLVVTRGKVARSRD